jgi:holo-[acyl-carrier protein] synthase
MMELGVDIVEISRVRDLAKRNPRFLTRIFSAGEIAYCKAKKDPWPHFAVRFAAKEAVYKALGRNDVRLKSISVARDVQGKPSVLVAGKPARGIKLTLSHARDHAVAFAVHIP